MLLGAAPLRATDDSVEHSMHCRMLNVLHLNTRTQERPIMSAVLTMLAACKQHLPASHVQEDQCSCVVAGERKSMC